ncbi:5664_t:CDS:2, partial [Racocetra fulgida]
MEANENLRKRNIDLVEEIEDSSELEEGYTTNSSNVQGLTSSNVQGSTSLNVQGSTSSNVQVQTPITSHFSSDRPLSKATVNRFDQKITKA